MAELAKRTYVKQKLKVLKIYPILTGNVEKIT